MTIAIDERRVAALVAAQFPQWTELPIRAVVPGGHDNRTFRLGDALSVRLPSAAGYAAAVEKEQRWLPRLAPELPCAIPEPVAAGVPGEGFPWPWSVNRWLEGEPATPGRIDDRVRFARDVAAVLVALRRIDPTDGPAAGEHSFHRGAPPAVYDAETRSALDRLRDELGPEAVDAGRIWRTALESEWARAPVWFHGDVAWGNLLAVEGRLSAVIDFGTCGVGDPASDLAIAWTWFAGEDRIAFRDAVDLDPATWRRARGWTLWKALITAAAHPGDAAGAEARRVLGEVLRDPIC